MREAQIYIKKINKKYTEVMGVVSQLGGLNPPGQGRG